MATSQGKHCQRKRRLRTMENGDQRIKRLCGNGGVITQRELDNTEVRNEDYFFPKRKKERFVPTTEATTETEK